MRAVILSGVVIAASIGPGPADARGLRIGGWWGAAKSAGTARAASANASDRSIYVPVMRTRSDLARIGTAPERPVDVPPHAARSTAPGSSEHPESGVVSRSQTAAPLPPLLWCASGHVVGGFCVIN